MKSHIYAFGIVIFYILVPSHSFSQEAMLPSGQFGTSLNIDKYALKNGLKNHYTKDIATSFSSVDIQIPSGIEEPKKKEIEELYIKLKKICPQCSTGGTVGGAQEGVIFGANTRVTNSSPLFGTASSSAVNLEGKVILTFEEYVDLKMKARLCENK